MLRVPQGVTDELGHPLLLGENAALGESLGVAKADAEKDVEDVPVVERQSVALLLTDAVLDSVALAV